MDIVERLRSWRKDDVCAAADEAADEIERLRGALNFYAANHEWPNDGPWGVDSADFGDIARAALEKK